jgi:hypothetical protein
MAHYKDLHIHPFYAPWQAIHSDYINDNCTNQHEYSLPLNVPPIALRAHNSDLY